MSKAEDPSSAASPDHPEQARSLAGGQFSEDIALSEHYLGDMPREDAITAMGHRVHAAVAPPVDATPFNVPSIFRYGHQNCLGDAFLRSSDGVHFCAIRCILWQASPMFRYLLSRPHPSLGDFPVLVLEYDAETVHALLQAIYPGPVLPIKSILLAHKCDGIANRYRISGTLFALDAAIFQEPIEPDDAFSFACLAWRMGSWHLFEKVSRWTHKLDLAETFLQAYDTLGGMEVLAALSTTRLERMARITTLIETFPRTIVCESCRSQGRSAYQAVKGPIFSLFDEPYPDVASLLSPSSFAVPAASEGCLGTPATGCRQYLQGTRYSAETRQMLATASDLVPQVVLRRIVEQKLEDQDTVLEAGYATA